MNQRAEADDNQAAQSDGLILWICGFIGIYLLPFIAVLVDEKILKTYWFAAHLSNGTEHVFRAMYPFYKLFNK